MTEGEEEATYGVFGPQTDSLGLCLFKVLLVGFLASADDLCFERLLLGVCLWQFAIVLHRKRISIQREREEWCMQGKVSCVG